MKNKDQQIVIRYLKKTQSKTTKKILEENKKINDIWSMCQKDEDKKKFLNLLSLGYAPTNYSGAIVLGPTTGIILGPFFYEDIAGQLDSGRIQKIEQLFDNKMNEMVKTLDVHMNKLLQNISNEERLSHWMHDLNKKCAEYNKVAKSIVMDIYQDIRNDLNEQTKNKYDTIIEDKNNEQSLEIQSSYTGLKMKGPV